MISIIERIYKNPSLTKTLQWGRLLSITGGAQVIVQAVSFISGILIIRLLPTQEYALYTLANAMLANMIALADGGITSGVTAQGGRIWTNRKKLGAVISTGFDLRRKFAIVCLLCGMPLLFFLFLHHEASWFIAVLIILSIIPSFFSRLSGTLLEITQKLHQDIIRLQKIHVFANFGRLILVGVALLAFPWAYVAILAAAIPQFFTNKYLRKISSSFADLNQKPDPEVRKKILVMVKRLLPEAIYVCVSAQLTIWLISLFGSTTAVAQLGALSRLGIMLTPFTILFASVIMPRFARLPNDRKLLMMRYLQIQSALFVFLFLVVGIVGLFSSEILWILGDEYSGLDNEVVLMILGSGLYVISHATFTLCTGKGWVINPLISIPLNIILMTIFITVLDVSTLRGVFLFTILINLVQVLMHMIYGILKIRRTNNCAYTV